VISERDIFKGRTAVSVPAVVEGEKHKFLLVWERDLSCYDWWVMPAALMSRARWGGGFSRAEAGDGESASEHGRSVCSCSGANQNQGIRQAREEDIDP
jgi:hypothetical protein